MITTSDLITAYGTDALKQWADDDRDGAADTSILEAYITRIEGQILNTLYPAFSAVMPFTAGNEPEAVKDIVITFVGYHLAGRRQKRPESLKESYTEAKAHLGGLLEKGAVLLFPDGATAISQGMPPKSSTYAFYSSTEDTERTFSDERMSDYVGDEP